jgi:hypothetical protein
LTYAIQKSTGASVLAKGIARNRTRAFLCQTQMHLEGM